VQHVICGGADSVPDSYQRSAISRQPALMDQIHMIRQTYDDSGVRYEE
jgi:hypothetical protein